MPAALRNYAASQASCAVDGKPRRALVPGCGSAYEAAYLDGLGWAVTALDFSAAAVEAARRNLSGWRGTLLLGDFFEHRPESPYALVYERAFLCALPRKLWPDYGPRMADLIAPRGHLAGYFFFSDELKGPPFGIGREALDALLAPHFELECDAAVADSVGPFAGRERWMVWRRR